MIVLRGIAAIAGMGILAAVAHVTITATGGYGLNTNAPLTVALAIGVAIGAPVAGVCWSGQRAISWLLILALVAGELYGFGATASWHVANLEAQAAPIHDAEAKHKAAVARLAAAEHSDTVERAEAAASKVQTDAMAKSAEKGCAANCRQVLEAQVRAATAAVEDTRASIQRELDAARAAVERAPLPGSANALADRTGIPAWLLDLVLAGLRSFACTVLAGALLAFAAHGRRHPIQTPLVERREEVTTSPKLGREQTPAGNVHDYVADRLVATEDATVPFRDVYLDYEAWCRDKAALALAPGDFAERLAQLCDGTDVFSRKRNGIIHLVNVRIANRVVLIENPSPKRGRLGQMTRLSPPKAV